MSEYNPFLTKSSATRGRVETRENIPWQTRAAAPTEYENRLGDALVEIFGSGVDALPDIVRRLNEKPIPDPAGQPWTEASFQAEMKKLA